MYNEGLRAEKRRVVTEDGSQTLYSCEFNEAYHSPRDGALNESLNKHVLPAFRFRGNSGKLTILDICFGLGYNTLATLYHVKKEKLPHHIHIVSPEFDRGLIESLTSFDYPPEFNELKPVIDQLSKNFFYEDAQFKIEILPGDARLEIPKIKTKFDVVYQDAFSPKKNPLLWTKEYFAQIRSAMKDDGLLSTYSVAAAVRMGLHENGFRLYRVSSEGVRDWILASPRALEGLEEIDMELKKIRNPDAKSLRDRDFIQEHET